HSHTAPRHSPLAARHPSFAIARASGARYRPPHMQISISPTDRLLVIAPHPDDESIGAGGLLLRAKEAGAEVRVIFCTSGDDNPWPQRAIEKRVFISASARLRWAARRREEARAALRFLIGSDAASVFLNLPDQGVTRVLLRG